MTGLPYSIGDPPGMTEPDTSYPCAKCIGARARQAVHDFAYDLKHSESLPAESRCEFEEKFGQAIVDMADWADETATVAAERDDNTLCERHAPSRDDEE